MFVSYAKGARTWERHVDIDFEGVPVSPYCSLPENVDTWFKAFKKAQEMSGGASDSRRVIPKKETEYLDALVRGVYARRNIPAGYLFSKKSFENDFYLAVPLKKGQLSVREIITGLKLLKDIEADSPLVVDQIDGPYSENPQLRKLIENRGL
jgi:N-acetylneuraminate synthase